MLYNYRRKYALASTIVSKMKFASLSSVRNKPSQPQRFFYLRRTPSYVAHSLSRYFCARTGRTFTNPRPSKQLEDNKKVKASSDRLPLSAEKTRSVGPRTCEGKPSLDHFLCFSSLYYGGHISTFAPTPFYGGGEKRRAGPPLCATVQEIFEVIARILSTHPLPPLWSPPFLPRTRLGFSRTETPRLILMERRSSVGDALVGHLCWHDHVHVRNKGRREERRNNP